MKLGAFSVSLSVKDINKSKSFYENLGFQVFGGDITQNWLIMKNESCVIGLFQGMFEKNILLLIQAGIKMPKISIRLQTFETFKNILKQKELKC